MPLKIQVLGKGIIPRGLGLAPRKEPFNAEYNTISVIVATPGLKVNMIHPDDGHLVEVTNKNLKRLYDTYSNYVPAKKVAPIKAAEKVEVPVQQPAAPVVEAKVEEVAAQSEEVAVEEKVEEVKVVEPVTKNQKYDKYQNKHNKNNQNNSENK